MLRINQNDKGYYVELNEFDSLDASRHNKLGYYCDKEHLKHMVNEIIKVFSLQELIDIVIKKN